MFKRVLVANRGVIACRIMRTLRQLGVEAVGIYSEADVGSLHVQMAAESVCVGPAPATASYLNIAKILEAAQTTGAQAVHPGYGFLSENPEFAEACESAGLVFLGPTSAQIQAFGLKNTARDLAVACNAPILSGSPLLADISDAETQANLVGYPVMLKSAGGGGGIGMRLCRDDRELADAFQSVLRLSETHFKGSGIFLEKYITNARHIEVQVFGDGQGRVVALGERDCSTQRRNQKVIEETPAPGLRDSVRQRLHAVAIEVMQSVQYRSAGTVEFLYDADTERFYFLEVNSRLQVEHGVTEEVFGVDLVEWMVRLGAGELTIPEQAELQSRGASIQVRVYAENPSENYQPSSGRVTEFVAPGNARVETWIENGSEITPFYDPLLAKLISWGPDRASALATLQGFVKSTRISGIETNLQFLDAVLKSSTFVAGTVTTKFLNTFSFARFAVKVLEPGVLTTVQSYPGRLGFWSVGVPPSGPMDAFSARLANRLLENRSNAALLECTLSGPTLTFLVPTQIVVTGADMRPTVDGKRVPLFKPVAVDANSVLALGPVEGPGARAYVAVQGGFNVPSYLGSTTTFTLGKFGGHDGRQLRAGDYLNVAGEPERRDSEGNPPEPTFVPKLTSEWNLRVLYGPHGAPDFFTDADIATFFSTLWRVHHNSSRTGVRLIGPKPEWARRDGGDAGLHPSNIHDNAYAIGAVDFTGDMPVVLGPDGPSLGGFVCPAVVINADLWKVGQLSPGDGLRFNRVTEQEAQTIDGELDRYLETLEAPNDSPLGGSLEPAILRQSPELDIVLRTSGDRYLLIEFGQAVLDLDLRFRVHLLMEAIAAAKLDGIIDLTPGIRSLQIHYDTRIISRTQLLEFTDGCMSALPDVKNASVPTRIVHLPLSWDDPATRLAIERYMSSVRADAPWCPSNLEFIRRINGLNSIEDVHKTVFDANYIVLGLGDVYLGAPVATPIDPRHRLVTTKYNPARTWTPENAVGIGGAYLCVYGMEGPGGYQFVGRTVQMWNTYRVTRQFEQGKPWLLRFFDQLRFYPVSAEELLDLRRDFPLGRVTLNTEDDVFRLSDYHGFLRGIQGEVAQFKARQSAAFSAERDRWAEQGEFAAREDETEASIVSEHVIPVGHSAVRSPTTASVWKLHVSSGETVQAGQRLLILEAMKMEIAVQAPAAGEVTSVLCDEGSMVSAGQPLLIYRPHQ